MENTLSFIIKRIVSETCKILTYNALLQSLSLLEFYTASMKFPYLKRQLKIFIHYNSPNMTKA